MAQWAHQSVATYTGGGPTWNFSAEGNNNFTLSDGEIGGADSLTFEAGDILDSGFFVSGDLFYVGTLEVNGETFIVGERVSTGGYELYSSQPLQAPSQFPASFDESAINTATFVVCFASGTRIATPTGAKTVETLEIGDPVLTADGRAVPVKWIGRQTVMPGFHPAERLRPVRIQAHALADNVPSRDLTVSADHGMILEGMIIHAAALVNGVSIVRVPLHEMGERFDYWHIETEAHDVILANDAPTETFVDNVSRRAFDNYAEFVALYGEEGAELAELDLPRAVDARQVPRATHDRLLKRAGSALIRVQ